MNRVGVVIQARMGSTRFPGKVLADLAGRPVLAWVVERAARARTVDDVIVATTTQPEDDAIADHCIAHGVHLFRGSVDDVLGRYHTAMHQFGLDIVVRVTADCPLVDPQVIDDLVDGLRTSGADYATNSLPMTLPHGLEASAMTRTTVDRAHAGASSPVDREHVTHYVRERTNEFTTYRKSYSSNAYDLRVTIDHPIDLEVVRFVVSELARRGQFGHATEIVAILREHPEVALRNGAHRPGEGLRRSVAEHSDADELHR